MLWAFLFSGWVKSSRELESRYLRRINPEFLVFFNRCTETVDPKPLRWFITPDRVWGELGVFDQTFFEKTCEKTCVFDQTFFEKV